MVAILLGADNGFFYAGQIMHFSSPFTVFLIYHKQKLEGNTEMKELAKRFIDRECVISSFDGNHQYEGIIKEVTDGAILVEKDGKIEAINLDFVIRIREYPRNKKGKKKSVVLD